MADFVPEHICRACYRVVTPGKDCAACTRWYEWWNAPTYPYTIEALHWFIDARGRRIYY